MKTAKLIDIGQNPTDFGFAVLPGGTAWEACNAARAQGETHEQPV
jgi:hypothetical protein